jgi:hypothetical protein
VISDDVPAPPTREELVQAWVDEALSRAPELTEEKAAVIGRLVFGPRHGAVAS